MAQRYEVSDAYWTVISPLLPQQTLGRPGHDPRQLWNGLFWVLHSGAPWRDLPARYGPWQTVYERFRRYRRDGTLARVLGALQLQLTAAQRLDVGTWLVDATHVRAGRAAAGARKKTAAKLGRRWGAVAVGRSRGGLPTKLHVVTDGQGLPLGLHLTPGPQHEAPHLAAVCEQVGLPHQPRHLVADRGYDSRRVRAWLRQRRIRAVIPRRRLAAGRRNRRRGRPPQVPAALYAQRNAVERFFG